MPRFFAAVKRRPDKAKPEDQPADPVPDRPAEGRPQKAQPRPSRRRTLMLTTRIPNDCPFLLHSQPK